MKCQNAITYSEMMKNYGFIHKSRGMITEKSMKYEEQSEANNIK